MNLEELQRTVKIPEFTSRIPHEVKHLIRKYKEEGKRLRAAITERKRAQKAERRALLQEAEAYSNKNLAEKFDVDGEVLTHKKRLAKLPPEDRRLIAGCVERRTQLRQQAMDLKAEHDEELRKMREELEDYTYPQIAKRFGVSVYTVQDLL